MGALLALNMLSQSQWSCLSSVLLYVNAMQSTGVGAEGGTGDEGVGEDVNETVGGAVGEDIRGTIRGVVGEVEAREMEMRETAVGGGGEAGMGGEAVGGAVGEAVGKAGKRRRDSRGGLSEVGGGVEQAAKNRSWER
ncbi:hypothetical protein BDZ91DRAFT_848969 [Kalaharituber pfeilii]|nr:hypothetical protein BDZ91DRAFT_848969 [Kalaharituber pfeilii]